MHPNTLIFLFTVCCSYGCANVVESSSISRENKLELNCGDGCREADQESIALKRLKREMETVSQDAIHSSYVADKANVSETIVARNVEPKSNNNGTDFTNAVEYIKVLSDLLFNSKLVKAMEEGKNLPNQTSTSRVILSETEIRDPKNLQISPNTTDDEATPESIIKTTESLETIKSNVGDRNISFVTLGSLKEKSNDELSVIKATVTVTGAKTTDDGVTTSSRNMVSSHSKNVTSTKEQKTGNTTVVNEITDHSINTTKESEPVESKSKDEVQSTDADIDVVSGYRTAEEAGEVVESNYDTAKAGDSVTNSTKVDSPQNARVKSISLGRAIQSRVSISNGRRTKILDGSNTETKQHETATSNTSSTNLNALRKFKTSIKHDVSEIDVKDRTSTTDDGVETRNQPSDDVEFDEGKLLDDFFDSDVEFKRKHDELVRHFQGDGAIFVDDFQ